MKTVPFKVELSDQAREKLVELMESFHLKAIYSYNWETSMSLLPPKNRLDISNTLKTSGTGGSGGSIMWCPTTQNWNAWKGCNIDEGPMAYVSSKESINELK
jgi:hypothetical protein